MGGKGFSPLAGIRWIERQSVVTLFDFRQFSFSPLAGIRWIESKDDFIRCVCSGSFSPLAGIRWIESRGFFGVYGK